MAIKLQIIVTQLLVTNIRYQIKITNKMHSQNASQKRSTFGNNQQTPRQIPSPKIRHAFTLNQSVPSNHTFINTSSNNSNLTPIQKAFKIQQLFNFPQLKTQKHYQKTVKQIAQLMGQFDKFTDHLQTKVDNLLIAQQNQFIGSYKRHMKKVEVQYKALQKQVQTQKQLITYYENEGKMSNLIKKVAMLEEQSKKLYAIIDKKQKQIKSVQLQIKVQKDEYKRLYGQYRQMVKNKNQAQISAQDLENNKMTIQKSLMEGSNTPSLNLNQDVRFFTTQVNQRRSIKKQLSVTADQNKRIGGFTTNMSQKTIQFQQKQQQQFTQNNQRSLHNGSANHKLKAQLAHLSLKHKKLSKISSKILQSRNQLQNIFINSVAEIKRQITVKRKIKACTYQDFKKEDKINLLLTIISNQQVLKYVYQRIFSNSTALHDNDTSNYSNTIVSSTNNQEQDESTIIKKHYSSILGPTRGYSIPTNPLKIPNKKPMTKLPSVI